MTEDEPIDAVVARVKSERGVRPTWGDTQRLAREVEQLHGVYALMDALNEARARIERLRAVARAVQRWDADAGYLGEIVRKLDALQPGDLGPTDDQLLCPDCWSKAIFVEDDE